MELGTGENKMGLGEDIQFEYVSNEAKSFTDIIPLKTLKQLVYICYKLGSKN